MSVGEGDASEDDGEGDGDALSLGEGDTSVGEGDGLAVAASDGVVSAGRVRANHVMPPATTTTTATLAMMMLRRRRCWAAWARRAAWRSALARATSRLRLLVATAPPRASVSGPRVYEPAPGTLGLPLPSVVPEATVFVTGFPAGSWGTNCYVVATAEGEDCLVVDPGQDAMEGLDEIFREHRLRPVAVLLTHGHIDHVWSVAPLAAGHDIPAYIHADDRYRLVDPAGSSFSAARDQLLSMTKGALELTEPHDVRTFGDRETLEIAGVPLVVAHAPGHTEGSAVFMADRDGNRPPVMLSGDLLFAGSIGRTDLPGGDPDAMVDSLRRVVLPLDDDTVVMPGHGELTTIGQERIANPFLVELAQGGSPSGFPTRGL